MAAASNVSPGWTQSFIFRLIAVSLVIRPPPSSSKCVDGTYRHDGRDCCLCGAGLYLLSHCTENLKYGKCETCGAGTYNSEPTSQTSCEPCTSCSQINDNLEEDEPCTPAANRKCRCQKNYYCSSREVCRICNPCNECVAEGIKVPCTAHNDTVCKDRAAGGHHVGTIFGAVFGVVLIVATAVIVYVCLKKRRQESISIRNPPEEAIPSLNEVKFSQCLPEIADIVGWKDMKTIAMSTGILRQKIDAITLDNKDDCEEQTIQLLGVFHEMHSTKAPEKLIKMLKRKGKNRQADSVLKLLRSDLESV